MESADSKLEKRSNKQLRISFLKAPEEERVIPVGTLENHSVGHIEMNIEFYQNCCHGHFD